MANITITNLPAVTSLNGTEDVPAVQSGVTVRLTTAQIAAYTASTFAVPSISIGDNIGGSTPGNGLYVNGSSQLGQFPYGSGVFTALQTSTGSTGGLVLYNGAVGTPTSLTLTLGSISVSGATNGYVLYNNAGLLGAAAPTAATLSIGSPVTGGTSGYGLYVDASSQLAQFAYGTGVRTALGVAVGSAGAPVLFNGAGGTPSSLTLTSATGLPVGGISATGTPSASTYLRGDGSWAALSAGTVTSVSFTGGIISVATATTTPALTVAGTSGGIPYFSSGTAWASSAALASNALVIGGGAGVAPATTTTGTGVLTALGNTTNAASGIAVKDANANLSSNNLFETLTVITAAGTVTTLTASSAYSFVVNGSGGQTIQLPDATTLPVGAVYRVNNNQSSGTVTVRNNSSTTVATLQSGSAIEITLLVNSPAAGTWDVHTLAPTNASWSTNTLSWTGTIGSGGSGSTWNAVPITVPYGGTGVTTSALGSIVVGSGSNTAANLSIGTTGQILTVVGGTAAWGQVSLTAGVTGVLPVANGGTGLSSTPANGALNIGNGTGFTRTTLTAGSSIAITNGAGSISIASTPGGSTTQIQYNNAGAFAGSANMTFDGTYISDGIGNVRNVPQNSQTGAYVLVAGDNGKHISITTGGVTVPSGIFSTGQTVSIFNNSGSNQTITQGSSVTLRQAGTASTGNRTLAQYGICTVLCVASNTFVINGTGLT